MSLARTIANNTIIQIIGRMIAAIVGVTTLSLVLHGFGESLQGKYILAISYAQFVATIADFGLTAFLVRTFSLKNNESQVGQVILFRLALSLGFFLVGAAIVFVLPYDLEQRQAIWLALIATFILSLNSVLVSFFQSKLEMKFSVIGDVLNRLFALVGTYVVLSYKLTFLGLIGAVLIGAVINICFLVFSLGGRLKVARRIDIKQWQLIALATLPIWITTVLGLIYFRIDTILLSVLPLPPGRTNLIELANYGTAYKFLEILIALPGMLLGTLMPVMVRAEFDRQRFSYLVRQSIYLISLFAAPITLGTFEIAHLLIKAFFPNLGAAADALQILVWAFGFSAFEAVFVYAIVSAGRQSSLVVPFLITSVVNIGLNFFLIPRYGFQGAAWTTVISELLVLLTSWYVTVVSLRIIEKPFDIKPLRPWLAALIMMLIISVLPDFLVLKVIVGAISYIILVWLMGGIDLDLFRKLRKVQ